MKMRILVLTASFSAMLVAAQTPTPTGPPTPTLPRSTTPTPPGWTNQPGGFGNLGDMSITNSSGESFSQEEIQSQLVELRSAIDQILPALNAISQVHSNSTAGTPTGGVVGGIASVLGGVLDRNTNNATGKSSTNGFGRVLRDAISAATTNSTSPNFAQLRDLVALQSHLQAATPILDRLGVSTNALMPSNIGGTPNHSLTNTGSGKSPQQP